MKKSYFRLLKKLAYLILKSSAYNFFYYFQPWLANFPVTFVKLLRYDSDVAFLLGMAYSITLAKCLHLHMNLWLH